MGKRATPTHATLVKGYSEENSYCLSRTCLSTKTSTRNQGKLEKVVRLLFPIVKQTGDEHTKTSSKIKHVHESIQFIMEMTERKLSFIDILINNENQIITLGVYYENTQNNIQTLNRTILRTKRKMPLNIVKRICAVLSVTNS